MFFKLERIGFLILNQIYFQNFCVKIEREETQDKQKIRKIDKRCVAGQVVLLTKMLCLLHAPP